MLLWLVFVLGIVITVFTRHKMEKVLDYGFYGNMWCFYQYVSKIPKKKQVCLHILVCISISLAGGYFIAIILSLFSYWSIAEQVAMGIVLSFIAYFVFLFILSLKQFNSDLSHFIFVLVLVLSIVGWSAPIRLYRQNIEVVSESIVEETITQELLYFCNVPVQNVSGEFTANSGIFSTSSTGSIDTVHEVTYWYVDEHGGGTFGTSPTDYSRIEFLEDGETPYVQIFCYYKYYKTIDHNIESESISNESRWKGYVYHLPREILQMPLS